MRATHATGGVVNLRPRIDRKRAAELAMDAHVAAVKDRHDQCHRNLHMATIYECTDPVCSSLAEVLTEVE